MLCLGAPGLGTPRYGNSGVRGLKTTQYINIWRLHTNLNSAAVLIGVSTPVEKSFDWQVHLVKPRLLSTAGERGQTVCKLCTSLFKVLRKVVDNLSSVVSRTLTPAVQRHIASRQKYVSKAVIYLFIAVYYEQFKRDLKTYLFAGHSKRCIRGVM